MSAPRVWREVTCDGCGCTLSTRRRKPRGRLFCDAACARVNQRRNGPRPWYAENRLDRTFDLTCAECHKKFTAPHWKIAYCGEQCRKEGTRRKSGDYARTGLSRTAWFDKRVELHEAQGRHCALCDSELPLRVAHLDHNHKTGEIRGVLCPRCNLGIGYFSDDVERLRQAIAYLEGSNT